VNVEQRPLQAASNRSARLVLWLCVGAVAVFTAWAWVFRLDIVSVADGRVVPSSRVQVVQHLEGGIVGEILVQEGDQVQPDQPMIILEQVISGATVEELRSRITALRVDIAALQAQAAARNQPVFDQDLLQDHHELLEQATSLFEASMARYRNAITAQRELISQREHALTEISTGVLERGTAQGQSDHPA